MLSVVCHAANRQDAIDFVYFKMGNGSSKVGKSIIKVIRVETIYPASKVINGEYSVFYKVRK